VRYSKSDSPRKRDLVALVCVSSLAVSLFSAVPAQANNGENGGPGISAITKSALIGVSTASIQNPTGSITGAQTGATVSPPKTPVITKPPVVPPVKTPVKTPAKTPVVTTPITLGPPASAPATVVPAVFIPIVPLASPLTDSGTITFVSSGISPKAAEVVTGPTPKIYGAPDGTTAGAPTFAQWDAQSGCLTTPKLDAWKDPMSSYGAHWTDTIQYRPAYQEVGPVAPSAVSSTKKTNWWKVGLAVATGGISAAVIGVTDTTTTMSSNYVTVPASYTSRKTEWTCLYPPVGTEQTYACPNTAGPFSYTYVSGLGTAANWITPKGTTQVANSSWYDNVVFKTKFGSGWSSATTDVAKMALLTNCGPSSLTSLIPKSITQTDGQYRIDISFTSETCLVLVKGSGFANKYKNCTAPVPAALPQPYKYSKKCSNFTYNDWEVVNYSILASPCEPGKTTTTTTTLPPPTPPPATPTSSTSTSVVTSITYFTCSYPSPGTITNPSGLKVTSGSVQAISDATPWTLTWPAPIIKTLATGTLVPSSETKQQQTALVIQPGSKPFNFNLSTTDPSQPVVGNPAISNYSNYTTLEATVPGWGSNVPTTVKYYKAGVKGDTFMLRQRQWFYGTWLWPTLSTDFATGVSTQVGTHSESAWAYCETPATSPFTILGVRVVPGSNG
jgi:hypothetical protein